MSVRVPSPYWALVVVLGLACALLAAALAWGGEPDCSAAIPRHERHVTRAVKRQAFTRDGVSWDRRAGYVVDHVVPLELGGTNDLQNLHVQGKAEGHAKDLVENQLRRCVCDGRTTLLVAKAWVGHFWVQVARGVCPTSYPPAPRGD